MGRIQEWIFRLTAPLQKRAFIRAITAVFKRAGVKPEEVQKMFSGYKTYIVAIVAIITALAAFLTGDLTLHAFLTQAWEILFPIIAIFLRMGIKKDAGK